MDSISNILSLKYPEQLFTSTNIKEEYRVLALKWHPDHNSNSKESNDVFAHINQLYEAGLKKIEGGSWDTPGEILLTSIEGSQFKIKYLQVYDFELGKYYVGRTVVAYVIKKEFKELYLNYVKMVKDLKYYNNVMEEEFSKYFPRILKSFETSDNYVICVQKTSDVYPLSNIVKYFGGKLDPRHVAWIISSLSNILCYFSYAGIVHNDISMNSVFVSPKYHSVCLYGGWWYSAKLHSKLISIPTTTFELMSPMYRTSKISDENVDSELMKLLGRKLLGDLNGIKLLKDGSIPIDLVNWLRIPSSVSRYKDYQIWREEVLIKSFGEIKFTPMEVDETKMYEL